MALHPIVARVDNFAARRMSIVGVPVNVINMRRAIAQIAVWVEGKESRYVCLADVHSVMCARSDKTHYLAIERADMVLPDGMPLVWSGRIRGEKSISRVTGTDLMAELCGSPVSRLWRHFFLGGAPGVAEAVVRQLSSKNLDLNVCGVYSPPFRQLSAAESGELIDRIQSAAPDIVWIGLGCPKQERWMAEHVGKIRGATLIGVGAAFDFGSGRIRRAPLWMQNAGLEWLHRLASEPRRLWRRYIIDAPVFVVIGLFECVLLRVRALNRH